MLISRGGRINNGGIFIHTRDKSNKDTKDKISKEILNVLVRDFKLIEERKEINSIKELIKRSEQKL